MKIKVVLVILITPLLIWGQVVWGQALSKSQCLSTIRARTLSTSAADAEKICAESSPDVINCTITKMQSAHSGGTADSVKACRSEWGLPNLPPDRPPDSGTTTDKKPQTSPPKEAFEEL